MDTFKNPLETVQLIPIFNYLNLLSDFLFTERFLPEIDQYKQIPIVNALYDYLQIHEHNKYKKVELIRSLLQGSDLYGEEHGEYFDETFVNAMFEHIISSLVFDKYGNIYGFLAAIFRNAQNLDIYEVLNLMIIELHTATFENEYGDDSVLSFLSVSRIFNEIILPLFPRAETNLSLLSLDYIYAQAGLMFLRAGRMNTTYYTDFENNFSNFTDDDSFDEFLVTGLLIEKLSLEKNNPEMLKAFALPALTYYTFNSKYVFAYENMANIISDSSFWQTAYEDLFQHTANGFHDIKIALEYDYTFKMHNALSTFQSSAALAKTFMEDHCNHLDENQKRLKLPFYLKYPKSFQCNVNNSLPSVEEYFKHQIDDISKIYQIYDLQSVQQAFPKSLIEELETNKVFIKLLIPGNREDCNFAENVSYDFLQFYFPDDLITEYYVLRREDYKAILMYHANNPEYLARENRVDFEKLFSAATLRTLKQSNENLTVFFQNLVNYKTLRLQTCLEFLDKEENKSLNWWKEFGFSLVPYYPCLSNTSGSNFGKSCKFDENKFLYEHLNDSPKLINTNTRSFLSLVDTTIRSLFLKNAINEIVPKEENSLSIANLLDKSEIFGDIAQNIQNLAFLLTFTIEDKIIVMKRVINSLKEKTNLKFTSIENSLSKILILKTIFFRSVGFTGKNRSRLIFVNTLNNQSATGYGYKFIFISDDSSRAAQFRTDYEFKNKRLLLPISSPTNQKTYLVLNNENLELQPNDIMYEINYQLRRKSIKVLFSGIPVQADDCNEKCNDIRYFQKWRHFNFCQRRERLNVKFNYEERAVQFMKKNSRLSEKQVRNTLGKFSFPDNATLMQFVNDWLKNNSSNETMWSSDYKIDNPILLNELRYNFRFENHDVAEYDGIFRINSIYSLTERQKIEEDASIETIIKDYNEQNATHSVTFHDYYAIRNFATTGYMRITRDTTEAKLMKIAIYKLAIRQSDDPVEEFDLKLFRVETTSVSHFGITSSNKDIKLKKFTTAFPTVESAVRFAGHAASGYMNILCEMVFEGPYPRAKIQQLYRNKEMSVILLPGSEFTITNGERVDIGGLGRVLKLTLKFKHTVNEKYTWYKNIMKEIASIKF